jgi:hypothetical protein
MSSIAAVSLVAFRRPRCSRVCRVAYRGPPRCPRARLTVARPLASPTPRPRVPRDLNMGAFLSSQSANAQYSTVGPVSTYLSMSGTMNRRTCEPRMYTRSRCVTLPSRCVTLIFSICTFMLSSAARSVSLLLLSVSHCLPSLERTFNELSAVCLSRGDFNRDLVAL